MISKKIYVTIVAIIISIIAIADFLAIVFDYYYLSQQIDKNFIKHVLLLFIPIMEVSYTKKFSIEIIGWIASLSAFMLLDLSTLQWFNTNPFFITALIILFAIFLYNHIHSKNIKYLNLLFQLFFFNRIIIILNKHYEILWWIDQAICFSILIVSIVYFINYIKKINLIEK